MPVNYYLQPNPITPDPNDQKAVVAAISVLDMDDIIQRAVNRGTTINQADISGAMQLVFDEISSAVADGYNVNTPLVNIRPTIQGVFTSAADSFDSKRHTLRATFSSGLLTNEKMAAATVQKVTGSSVSPDIIEFIDTRSNSNSQASQGGIGTLIGKELKFDPTGHGEGIFFINTADGTETQVTEISTRTEGRLVFIIPATLLAGITCWLEVRRAYTAAATLRIGRLTNSLAIIA